MQAVVSEGASPLPAELRLKYDAVHPDQFFGIDPSPWPQESPPSYIYDSAMQINYLKTKRQIRNREDFEYNRKNMEGVRKQ